MNQHESKQFALLAALPARKLIKTIGLAILLLGVSSALIGASKASHAQSNNARSNIDASESTVTDGAKRSMLGKNGGTPGAALSAYFAAIEARDWNAMRALTVKEVRETFEQD